MDDRIFHFWFASSNLFTDNSMLQVYSCLEELDQGKCLAADQLSSQFFKSV